MLNSRWVLLPRSVLPTLYNSFGQALRLLSWQRSPDDISRRSPDEQDRSAVDGPAGGQPRQTWPHFSLFWEAIFETYALTGEVRAADLLQLMRHRFPEPRSSFAWRDACRSWRAEETVIWRQVVLDTVIADLGRENASDALVPVVEAIVRGMQVAWDHLAPVQESELPVEMDID